MTHQQVQQMARETIGWIRQMIHPGMSLADVRRICEEKMLELGADSFWYWDVGAFVFSGDETAVSVSGRTYVTSERIIAPDDIVTIDLSPQVGDTWGDYARTLILQDGAVVETSEVRNPEWKQGLEMEELLHRELLAFAKPETTFEEQGFVNLDFAGNLGHSIARRKDDRIYTEKGNQARLGDVEHFTFEPHISLPGSKYGYKKENIYLFEDGVLKEL